jgi:hypothetical protein
MKSILKIRQIFCQDFQLLVFESNVILQVPNVKLRVIHKPGCN